jgi:hypothetical protein
VTVSYQVLIGFVVTVGVAVLAIFGNILNERYKRYQGRTAVAAVIGAEISALLEITMVASTPQNWDTITHILDENDIDIPKLSHPEPSYGIVFENYVDKLGLLDPQDAKDIILFYEYLMGIRHLLKNLGGEVWSKHPHPAAIKAANIRAGLGFWNQCNEIAQRLIPSLERTAGQTFRWLRKEASSDHHKCYVKKL